jgi:hypothetical protein
VSPLKQRGSRVEINGHTIEIVSCLPTDLVDAYKAGGDSVGGNLDLLARALRKVDGQPVNYLQARMQIPSLFPRTRHQTAMLRVLDGLHAYTEDEAERVLGSREPSESSAGYSEVVTLPDGRKVRIQEIELRTVGAMLKSAQKTSKVSEEARNLSAMLDCLRKSIIEINGQAVHREDLEGVRWNERFTVADTMVLYMAWSAMHTDDDEVEVHEMGE